jgi:hypothetical protein
VNDREFIDYVKAKLNESFSGRLVVSEEALVRLYRLGNSNRRVIHWILDEHGVRMTAYMLLGDAWECLHNYDKRCAAEVAAALKAAK